MTTLDNLILASKKFHTFKFIRLPSLLVCRVYQQLSRVPFHFCAYIPDCTCICSALTYWCFAGKSGPLFNFDVKDDIRIKSDAAVEKNESHAGEVLMMNFVLNVVCKFGFSCQPFWIGGWILGYDDKYYKLALNVNLVFMVFWNYSHSKCIASEWHNSKCSVLLIFSAVLNSPMNYHLI